MGKPCSKADVSKMIKKSEKKDVKQDKAMMDRKPSKVSDKRIADYGKKKK